MASKGKDNKKQRHLKQRANDVYVAQGKARTSEPFAAMPRLFVLHPKIACNSKSFFFKGNFFRKPDSTVLCFRSVY